MIDESAEALRSWYRASARPFIHAELGDRIPALDAAIERTGTKAVPELPICFLGAAGVGKSTLLNALIGGSLAVVPQGGVGPLTAQATLIKYGAERRFVATYVPRKRLQNMLFVLEMAHVAELRRKDGEAIALSDPDPIEVDAAERAEAEAAERAVAAGEQSPILSNTLDGYFRQACLMIVGNQFSKHQPERGYIIDALRACLNRRSRWNSAFQAEDQDRIERIRGVLGYSSRDEGHEIKVGTELNAFLDELEMHASGHLAPLIHTLEVWWDADVLKDGLVLVDLPGVGVANDEYARVTAEWIRKARAVVLVVDRAGVTAESAELLHSSGFLNSLLHEGDDPDAEMATLIVAAVKLDLSATDARNLDVERRKDKAKRWAQHFDEVCTSMEGVLRSQLGQQLERLSNEGADETLAARKAVAERVLSGLRIQTLTPYEYRTFLRDFEDDRPRIRNPEESRVPAFIELLRSFGEERARRLHARAVQRYTDARVRIKSTVELLVEQWRGGERAAAEAARLREELLVVAKPLEREMAVREGKFIGLLRDGMPREIEAQTTNAAHAARQGILKHLRKYESYHWATLRAAVRKEGAFDGSRHIHLPNELTLRFEEPLAAIWSDKILRVLRQATREIAEDYASLVGEIVSWARGQGTRVKPAVVEALHEELRAQAKDVAEVGKEAITDLKERVKSDIFSAVEAEIRKRCQQFVRRQLDVGPGVKMRMLEFLREELADAIVEAARPAAQQVLERNFRRVEKEIKQALGHVSNPIQQAVDGIVSAHETHVQRSDAQRRSQVITTGERVLGALPAELAS